MKPSDNAETAPSVFIIVLNWNNWQLTNDCTESLQMLVYPNFRIIIVDNASTDNSVQRIKEKFPEIKLIETHKNLGYAGGNNVGIKYALDNKAKYVLIVNNDTELVNAAFLHEMIDKMTEDPSIGIMGPKILSPDRQVQDTILFTPTLLNCLKQSFGLRIGSKKPKDYNISQTVEVVSGVCWLIKTNVVKKVGLLDEDYFMYAEEQDYCYRAKKAGWEIMYFPVESVLHKKHSEDENNERMRRQYIFARRNLVLFLHKHFGFWQALLLTLLFLLSNVLKVIFCRLTGKEKAFYNTSILSALFYEFKYVLCDRWKKANKYTI